MRRALLLAGLFLAPNLHAQQGSQQALDAPPPPPPVQSGEVLEPDVTIIQREDATHHEYRVNGQLYMVKVVPQVGPAYYLVDRDGDGSLESRTQTIHEGFQVPQWVIKTW